LYKVDNQHQNLLFRIDFSGHTLGQLIQVYIFLNQSQDEYTVEAALQTIYAYQLIKLCQPHFL